MTQVSQIMTTNVVTVPKKKGVKELVRIMASSKISSVIITENERLIGIVTERDMIKKILMPGKTPDKVGIDEVMTVEPMSINSHTDISEASEIMRSKGIRHLPVVDNGKLVGLITQTDIVKETHEIHKKNVHFMTYQNIQTFIIIGFFVFLGLYLLYKYLT